MTQAEIQDACKQAFIDAFKDRFAKIAANELSITEEEGAKQFELALRNLRRAYEQASSIACRIFTTE